MSNLNKLKELSWKDRWRLLQAVLLLPVIHIALTLLGYARVRRMMEYLATLKSIHPSPSDGWGVQRGRELARLVAIAAQHGAYKATCLRRSLLIWWFLRSEGISGHVCFGVRMAEHRLEAHAWVDVNGVVVSDSQTSLAQYQPLYESIPSTELGL